MTFRYLEHMTDAFIEVTAQTLDEAFEVAGVSVVDTILDIKSVEKKKERRISIESADLNNLLYSWLEEIIILTITEGFAGASFQVSVSKSEKYLLVATVFGEDVNIEKHHFKVEVKAPTFHLMDIRQDSKVVMQFLLDL